MTPHGIVNSEGSTAEEAQIFSSVPNQMQGVSTVNREMER